MRRSIDDPGVPLNVSALPAPLTLKVPARPEALSIVRLVVMSCGAAAGLSVKEIFACSQEAAEAFADALVRDPEATNVVVRTQMGVHGVDLRPVRAVNG